MAQKYLTNKQLLEELKIYEKTKVVSDNLVKYWYLMAKKLANRRNFSSYSWKDDMIQRAVIRCFNYVSKFDNTKSNPFAYFSMIIFNEFVTYIKKQKKDIDLLNKLKEIKKEELIQNNQNYDTKKF
jgi:DNA-directed RNA polymerase specialized sigma24 family protein